MPSWFDYPITQSHQSDDGVDLGTRDQTPVSFPFSGTVIDASYHNYGGQTVVAINGTGYSEYFIHLDDVYKQVGDHVSPGEIIGDTGGGVGDKVKHNGVVQPAQSQSWYDGHSSGYHTEFGIFRGETMGQFNQGWHNPSRQLDPTPVIEELRQGKAVHWPGAGGDDVLRAGLFGYAPFTQGAQAGLAVAASPFWVGLTNLFPWLTNPQLLQNRLISGGVAMAGLVFIGFGGLFIYAATQDRPVTQVIQETADRVRARTVKAAETVGMAAAA